MTYYLLQGIRRGEKVVEVQLVQGFAANAFRRASEIVVAYGDTHDPIDVWTLTRIEDK